MTMNSPESMLELYRVANGKKLGGVENQSVWTAELMREVGLKCIGFNGVGLFSISLSFHYHVHLMKLSVCSFFKKERIVLIGGGNST